MPAPSLPVRFWLTSLAVLAAVALPTTPADAQCVPDPASTGDDVVCDGNDPDGFQAGAGVDMLAVDILDTGTVDNGGGGAAIGVNDESSVGNDGGITATNANAVGIAAGDGNAISNRNTIDVSGDGSAGIAVGSSTITVDEMQMTPSVVLNDESARVDVSGTDSTGISAVDGVRVTNAGTIDVTGSGATGVEMGTSQFASDDSLIAASIVLNDVTGTIDVSGGDNTGILTGDLGGIQNSGTLMVGDLGGGDANGTGIASGDGVTTTNAGDITVTGAGASGIVTGDSVVDVDDVVTFPARVTNRPNATITVNGDAATGISAGTNSDVSNFDTITVNGDDATGISAGTNSDVLNRGTISVGEAGDADGVGIVGGEGSSVQNTGTLRVEGQGAVGLVLGLDARLDNRRLDDQSPPGSIEATGDGARGVVGGGGAQIENSGSITVDGAGAIAVQLADGDTLLNLGTVEAIGAGSVAVLGSGGSETVLNDATLTGDVDLAGGDDVMGVAAGHALTGSLLGGSGDDLLSLRGTTDASFDLGTQSGFERLDIGTSGAFWTLSGTGSFSGGIEVIDGGGLVLDGIQALTGDFTQTGGTTLVARLNPDGTGGRLDLVGAASIEDGTRLRLDATGSLPEGQPYTILTYTDGITGEFTDIQSPVTGSAFLRFEATYGANAVEVQLRRVSYASAAITPNQRSVARALDRIQLGGATGDMANLLGAIDGLRAFEFPTAADEMSPEVYDGHTHLGFVLGRSFTRALQDRPLRCEASVYPGGLEGGETPPPCSEKRVSPFATLIGDFGDREGPSGHLSYDHYAGGLAIGVDARPTESLLLSAQVGGSLAKLEFGERRGNGNQTTLEIGAQAAWVAANTSVRAILGYGHGWHETRREMRELVRRANASHRSNRLSAVAEVAHSIDIGRGWAAEPIATADFSWLSESRVDEKSAGAANLRVEGRSNSLFSTTLGVRLHAKLFKYAYMGSALEWADGVWRPEIDVRWREFWSGNDRSVSASFQGASPLVGSFTVDARDASRGLEAAAGVTFQPVNSRTTVHLGYDVFYGGGNLIHGLMAKVRIPLP